VLKFSEIWVGDMVVQFHLVDVPTRQDPMWELVGNATLYLSGTKVTIFGCESWLSTLMPKFSLMI